MRYIKWIIITILCVGLWYAGRRSVHIPTASVAPDTIYVQKDPPKLKPTPPEILTVYKETTKLDTIYIQIPVQVANQSFGVIGEAPVQVKRRSVILRSFNPETLSWQDQTFRIPPKRFRFGVYGFGGMTTVNYADNRFLTVGASLQASYKRFGMEARGSITGNQVRWGFYGTYRIF